MAVMNAGLLCAELLHAIFMFATPTGPDDEGMIRGARLEDQPVRRAPWNFAAVCKRWRVICLASSDLWTHFSTSDHQCQMVDNTCVDGVAIVRCLFQVQRSGSRPISVNIDSTLNQSGCTFVQSFIRSVATQCYRWYWLNLRQGIDFGEFDALMPASADLSALRSFKFATQCALPITEPSHLDDPQLNLALATASGLTSLSLVLLDDEFQEMGIPCARLVQLDLGLYSGSAASLLDLLGQCTTLQYFHWWSNTASDGWFSEDDEFDLEGSETIVLTCLSHLRLEPSGPSDIFMCSFPFIQTPALHAVSVSEYMDVENIKQLSGLISRSDCNVHSFEAILPTPGSERKCPSDEYRKLLGTLTGVEDLVIRGHDSNSRFWMAPENQHNSHDTPMEVLQLDDVLLQPLLDSARAAILLPKLRRLRIQDAEFDPIMLVQLLEARQEAASAAPPTANAIEHLEIDYLTPDPREKAYKPHDIARYYQMALRTGVAASEVLTQGTQPSRVNLSFSVSYWDSVVCPRFEM